MADEPTKPNGSSSGGEIGALSHLSGLFWQAIPAIGSAVGFVGFVAILGGAIEWVRFTSAGLPVDQAVGAVLQKELVIVGATALISFILLGLLATFVAYLIDGGVVGSIRLGWATVVLAVVEAAIALFTTPASLGDRVLVGGLVALAAILVALIIDSQNSAAPDGSKSGSQRKFVIKADQLREPPSVDRGEFGLLLGMVVLFTAIIGYVVSAAGWILLLLGLAVVMNLALFAIARKANRFFWYGVAVFLSVPVYGAALEAVRTHRFPKVQPVALIRKSSDLALCGIYIGESNNRVYIGRVQVDNNYDVVPGTGRIFWVPESEVDMIKIGASQSIADANGRGPELAEELYADRVETPPAQVKGNVVETVVKESSKTTKTTTKESPPTLYPPARKEVNKHQIKGCSHIDLTYPREEGSSGYTKDP